MRYTALHNETEILVQVSKGDKTAFKQLYDHYWNNIYTTALSFLKSPERAEDIVQDVFLTVWEKKAQLVEIDNFSSYLYITARNRIISTLRKKTEEPLKGNYEDILPSDLLLPGHDLDSKQLAGWIKKGIERLSPQQQTIFHLTREQGLTHKQISEQLGIEERTVNNHMTLALNKLRLFLQDHTELIILFASLSAAVNNF